MDLDGQITLGHLLLNDRKCTSCGEIKNLVEGFYRTRKNKGSVPSSYSYECKECTIKRVRQHKKGHNISSKWEYPDW
jgi:predicted nucleic acid-binding Zn ribbon protein